MPNFDASCPVAIAALVCASTPGLTRSSTGTGSVASREIRATSSRLSTTMWPMPISIALAISASDFALP